MTIAGLQKLSMVDYPDKLCCTVFLPGCNLRCPFCHNAALIPFDPPETIDEDDFFAFLATRKGKLDGVCISGGEPLLSPGLADFIRRIRAAGFSVKLDTNGTLPDKLNALLAEHLLDYVAMDIKAAPKHYGRACGGSVSLDAVRRSIALLLGSTIDCEFRTTAVLELHEPSDFTEIAQMIAGAKHYYIQKFVDSGGLLNDGYHALSDEQMRVALNAAKKLIPGAALRGM